MKLHNYIGVFTGKRIDPFSITEEDIDIRDISHSLAIQSRYLGHTFEPYSVAQHCVYVSRRVPPADALWGLLHDASEAYLGDVARPLKYRKEFADYRVIEAAVQRVICQKFGLDWMEPHSVTQWDGALAYAERRDLTALGASQDGYVESFSFEAATIAPICCWNWSYAEQSFLDCFESYTSRKAA